MGAGAASVPGSTWSERIALCLIVCIGMVVRFPLIRSGSPFYTSDVAMMDLMSKHFTQGEFSIYYWGQNYYGVLDPIFLIPLFKIFGFRPETSQLLPYLFTISFLFLYHRFLRETADTATAHLATLILAVGSPYFIGIGFEAYGYLIISNFGILSLWLFERMRRGPVSKTFTFLTGLFMGVSWYYFRLIGLFWAAGLLSVAIPLLTPHPVEQITQKLGSLTWRRVWNEGLLLKGTDLHPALRKMLLLVNLINGVNACVAAVLWVRGDWIGTLQGHTVKLFFSPICESTVKMTVFTLAVVFWKHIRALWRIGNRRVALPAALTGFLIGYLPALIGSMTGHSPATNATVVSLPTILKNVHVLISQILPFMFAPGDSPFLKTVTALVSLAGAVQLLRGVFPLLKRSLHPFPVLFLLNLGVVFFLMRIGDRWNARYLFPLFLCLPLGIAQVFLRLAHPSRQLSWLVMLLFLFGNASAQKVLPRTGPHVTMDQARLIAQALADRGVQGGYADLWVAYVINAVTDEKIILAPTGSDDRYKPYLEYVRSLKQVVLLEKDPLPVGSRRIIKGVPYRVLKVEPALEFFMIMMERTS